MRLKVLFSILAVSTFIYFNRQKNKEDQTVKVATVAIDAGDVYREVQKNLMQDDWEFQKNRQSSLAVNVKSIEILGESQVSEDEILTIINEMGRNLTYGQIDILTLKIKKLYQQKGTQVLINIEEDAFPDGVLRIQISELN